MSLPDGRGGSWTLLTGHGHVLVEIARNPQARIRDIATGAGITERTAQAIVADLEAAGYITRTRTGRRTRYSVNPDSSFRHPAQEGLRVGPFLALPPRPGTTPPHLGQMTGEIPSDPSRPVRIRNLRERRWLTALPVVRIERRCRRRCHTAG